MEGCLDVVAELAFGIKLILCVESRSLAVCGGSGGTTLTVAGVELGYCAGWVDPA